MTLETYRPPWYAVPLCRCICNDCGAVSSWFGDVIGTIFWRIMHVC